MSSGIRSEGEERRPVTLTRLTEMHEAGEPIVMITAYDFPSAQVIEEAGADIVLVGDSAANCVLGYDSTVPVGMDEMTMLAKAVRRGLRTPFLVGDLPFGSYEASNELAIASAQRLIKEAGCDAVKLEGGGTSVERARAIIDAGIPVMGHVGLTPQTATALGGMRAQGKTAQQAIRVAEDAVALDQAGCFAIVIEAVPEAVAEMIVAKLKAPTIGIGAGNATAGQVLVLHDLAGINASTARISSRTLISSQAAPGIGNRWLDSSRRASLRLRSEPAGPQGETMDGPAPAVCSGIVSSVGTRLPESPSRVLRPRWCGRAGPR